MSQKCMISTVIWRCKVMGVRFTVREIKISLDEETLESLWTCLWKISDHLKSANHHRSSLKRLQRVGTSTCRSTKEISIGTKNRKEYRIICCWSVWIYAQGDELEVTLTWYSLRFILKHMFKHFVVPHWWGLPETMNANVHNCHYLGVSMGEGEVKG